MYEGLCQCGSHWPWSHSVPARLARDGTLLTACTGSRLPLAARFERIGVMKDQRRKRVGTKLVTPAVLLARARKLDYMSTVFASRTLRPRSSFTNAAFALVGSQGL